MWTSNIQFPDLKQKKLQRRYSDGLQQHYIYAFTAHFALLWSQAHWLPLALTLLHTVDAHTYCPQTYFLKAEPT